MGNNPTDTLDRATEPLSEAPETETSKNLRPVFIVGFPRSGTTWLMWLLAKLPSVVALQQSGMFHALRDAEKWWKANHAFSKESSTDGTAPDGVLFDGTQGLLPHEKYYELVRPFCAHVHEKVAAASPGTNIVVEQTPENLEFQETIRAFFPDAYFLHIVRDPRDACVSMLRAAKSWDNELPGRPIHVANRWNEYMRRAKKLREQTENFAEIRYEDLKTNGVEELGRIAKWLGLDLPDAAIREAFEAAALDRMRERPDLPTGFFGRGKTGGWRHQLSRSNHRVLEYIVGDEMERMGYEREHSKSRKKPFRLKFHHWLSNRLERYRLPFLKRSKRLRGWIKHLREEIDYSQRMHL